MAEIWQSPLWPRFRHDSQRTEAALAAFALRLGRVTGLQSALSPDEQHAAFVHDLSREAVASASVDGITMAVDDIATAARAVRASPGAAPQNPADAVATLMLDARMGQGPLTDERLHHWHALSFHNEALEEKAQWRTSEVEIVFSTRSGREDVFYTAPPPAQVPGDMAAFLAWLNRTDQQPAPLRAALAHLWFESIHPYSDGSGRVGRAIVDYVVARDMAPPFSLSHQIMADKRGYYAALRASRLEGAGGIDGTEFVLWFLDRLNADMAATETDARFLLARNEYFRRFQALPPRAETLLRRLFAAGPDRLAQGLSAGQYATFASVSAATATRDLAELEATGALQRGPKGGRSTRYQLVL